MKRLRATLGFLMVFGVSAGLSSAALGPDAGLVATYGLGGTPEAQDSGGSQDALGGAITRGLGLLETKRYVEFLQMFLKPEDLKELTERRTLDEVAKEYTGEFETHMLVLFRRIKTMKPVMNPERTTATFTLPGEGIDGENEFTFLRVGKDWYIED